MFSNSRCKHGVALRKIAVKRSSRHRKGLLYFLRNLRASELATSRGAKTDRTHCRLLWPVVGSIRFFRATIFQSYPYVCP